MARTPGNWKVTELKVKDSFHDNMIYYDVSTDDPEVYSLICTIHSENPLDDAQLLAAAPQLLEAAEVLAKLDLSSTLEGKPDNYPVYALNESVITVGDVRKARAAIASARGEA